MKTLVVALATIGFAVAANANMGALKGTGSYETAGYGLGSMAKSKKNKAPLSH